MKRRFLHLVFLFCFKLLQDTAKGTEIDQDSCAHGLSQGHSLIQVNRNGAVRPAKLALASLSVGSGLGLAARNGTGLDQVTWASNSESQFGYAHMKLILFHRVRSESAVLFAIVLALLGILAAFVARSIGSADSGLQAPQVHTAVAERVQLHKHAVSNSQREQVPVIPVLRLPKPSGPQYQPEVLPHSHTMVSSQVSLSIASESTAQKATASSLMSVASIGSGMCHSASVYPPPSKPVLVSSTKCEHYIMTARRSAGSLGTLSPYRNRSSGLLPSFPEVAASGGSGVHYMMTARNGGSLKSTRTPSPFRTSLRHTCTDTFHMSPRFPKASNRPSNTHEPPEHERSEVTPSQAATSSINSYPRGRAPTASMEGLKGVKGRVEWFNLGTPRPPEGCAPFPTPRTGF